jgi:hypothetical protein
LSDRFAIFPATDFQAEGIMAVHSAFEDSENRALAKIKETVRY